MIAYLKLVGIAAAVALLLAIGWHFGGLSSAKDLAAYRTAVEAQHAVQLQAVVDTMTQHDKQAAAQHAADQKVIDAYDLQSKLPPITAGFVQRMRLIEAAACSAGDRVLPSPGSLAGGADAAGGIPGGDAEGDRLLQVALDKAAGDSLRLNAVVKFAPKRN